MPQFLFHYTTFDGLSGIIENKCLWASQIQYLNDSQEFNLAVNIAMENLEKHPGVKSSNLNGYLLTEMKKILVPAQNFQVFVCSFSEEEDLLSQWRGYCFPGPGFSLGFKATNIQSLGETQGFSLVPCLYDRPRQDKIVRELIELALNLFNQDGERKRVIPVEEDINSINQISAEFAANLSFIAPIFKHPSFREEKEWRLISPFRGLERASFGYRKGSSFIIPYCRFKLKDNEGNFNISKIVIGPTPHRELSLNSTSSFLTSNNISGCEVLNSSTPFRNW